MGKAGERGEGESAATDDADGWDSLPTKLPGLARMTAGTWRGQRRSQVDNTPVGNHWILVD
jgi:hypothetical protein